MRGKVGREREGNKNRRADLGRGRVAEGKGDRQLRVNEGEKQT